MLDGGGPACSSPIRVPTTILMNIVLVRKQNKTKQNKKQKINNTSSSSSSCIYRRTSIPLCILSTISPSHCTQESFLRPRTPT
jgi:hypothetical protein